MTDDFELDQLSLYSFADKSVLKNIGLLVKFGAHTHVFEFGWWKTFDDMDTFIKHFKEGELMKTGLIQQQFNSKDEDVMGIKNIERLTLLMTIAAPKEEYERLVNVLANYQYGKFDLLHNNSRHFVIKAAAVTKAFGYEVDENSLLNAIVAISSEQEVQKIYYAISILISTSVASLVPVYNVFRFPLGLFSFFTLALGFQEAEPWVKGKVYDNYSKLYHETLSFVESLRQ